MLLLKLGGIAATIKLQTNGMCATICLEYCAETAKKGLAMNAIELLNTATLWDVIILIALAKLLMSKKG